MYLKVILIVLVISILLIFSIPEPQYRVIVNEPPKEYAIIPIIPVPNPEMFHKTSETSPGQTLYMQENNVGLCWLQ